MEENCDIEKSKSKGDILEKSIEFIFNSAGFETIRNTHIAKYEIDVLAKVGDRDIVLECKNYQNSSLVIRNLIHQWSSKNKIIKASKIILVIAGLKAKSTDHKLANDLDIEIWDDDVISELFNLTLKPTELRAKLITMIDFKPITISQLYRDKISEMVIYPLLGKTISEEEIYNNFIKWLSAFIRTELQVLGTTKDERLNHVQLFEDTKQKKGFLHIKFKRSAKEYWDNLLNNLKDNNLFDKKQSKRYSNYMNELVEEYNSQKEYYENKNSTERIRVLIKNRLYNSLISTKNVCEFGDRYNNSLVTVESPGEGQFILKIKDVSDKNAEIISWILTSEYLIYFEQITEVKVIKSYLWNCTSLEDASEKTYRILDEYYGIENEIIDLKLIK
jgi:hypothetical protein